MADGERVLVVEDEAHLAAGLKLNLELDGFAVEVATTAREAGRALVQADAFDAVILDVMLPDVSGFELCRKLREAGNFVPVLMLTARNSAEDRVQGLEVGADDYLAKPFDLDELLARVRSLLRRARWAEARAEGDNAPRELYFADVRVDLDSRRVEASGREIELTQLEFDLLCYLVQRDGKVVSRNELLENVWKLKNHPNTRTVDNFMVRLRKMFEPDPQRPRHFLSVRGVGYRFVAGPAQDSVTR